MDVDVLKSEVIEEFLDICKKMSNGYSDICFQDTLNKILFINNYKCLK